MTCQFYLLDLERERRRRAGGRRDKALRRRPGLRENPGHFTRIGDVTADIIKRLR
jgi:hypothetical protein